MKAKRYNQYWVQLEFASAGERAQLESVTSYHIPGSEYSASYSSGHWDGTKKFLTTADKLPMGLFKSIFPEHTLCYDPTIEYGFDDIPLFKRRPDLARRDYQLEAINNIFKHKRGLIAAVVGAGKTLISAAAISKHLESSPGKALFICYDKNILSQTIDNYKKYGFKVSQYGGGVKDLSGDVIVATIQSLTKIQNPAKILEDITMCFADESHHSKSKTSRDVMTKLKNCSYYIGLTATPPKPDTLELAELTCVLGPVMFEYGFTTAATAGNITPVKCFFLRTPFSYETKAAVVNRRNYKYIWDSGVRDSEIRNKVIAKVCEALVELLDTPILVNVDRVEHGNRIQEAIEQYCAALGSVEMYGEDNIVVRELKKAALSYLDSE